MRHPARPFTKIDILILAFVIVVIAAITIPILLRTRLSEADQNPAYALHQLVALEEIWKSRDLDRNGVGDYWVKDIRGFYGVQDASGSPIRLIDLRFARADKNPGFAYDAPADVTEPRSGADFYYFIAMAKDQNGNSYIDTKLPATSAPPASGHCTNVSRFGFTAFPRYALQRANPWHFMVNEDGVIWCQQPGDFEPVMDRSLGPPPGSSEVWSLYDVSSLIREK